MAHACEWCVASVLGIEAERHEGANKRQIFFFLFQFWGCSDCSRRVSQVDEADNYAWTPDTVKMSFDPGHLACSCVSVINILSFGIYDSRGGSHGNTVVVWLCQWLITLCMLPVPSESVDWNDRKSQECGAAIRNQSSPSWPRSIKLLVTIFREP